MKPSDKKLGLELQLFLMRQGLWDRESGPADGHYGGWFVQSHPWTTGVQNETLEKMANTQILKDGGVTLPQLRAWRAVDEYSLGGNWFLWPW